MSGIAAYLVFFAIIASIMAVATLGLNLQWGVSGQFNAGIAGFIAVGGYVTAILVLPPQPGTYIGYALTPWIAVPLATLATAAVGGLVGVSTVRLRGDYLAVASFGIASIIVLVINNADLFTGGARGLIGLPRPFASLGRSNADLAFLALMATILALTAAAQHFLLRSPWGRTMRAIRDDEVAAASLGKNVAGFRLMAFVLGSGLLGLAGGLYVLYIGGTSPADFLPILTFQIWAMLIVGGSGSIRGAILGAFLVWGLWSASGVAVVATLPTAFQVQGGALQSTLIGLLLVITLLRRPYGLLGHRL